MSELIRKPYKITLWEDRNVYFYTKTVTTVTVPDSLARRYNTGFYTNFDPNIDYMSIVNNYINYRDWENVFYYAGIRDHKLNTWQGETYHRIHQAYLNLYGSTTITYTKSYEQIDDLTQVLRNQCLEEICIATIGSDTMDTPIRAFNPILTEELNGSKTLTFQINYRYWDDEEEEFKLNPFINLLVNERKVKLKYDNNWYDFVIKQTDENSDSNTFTYTCKDLFINELGKTGYEVELDTELRNNMGTITELATSILKGTDWQVDEDNCDPLIQRNKEGLYSFITNSDIPATNILEGTSKIIPSGKVILVFYSCKANKDNPIQFLYKEQGDYSTIDEAIANFYKIDEYGFVVDADNYEFTFSELGNLNTLDAFYNSLASSSYFGQKIIKKQEMHYLPQIDETCMVYTHYDKESAESGNPQENQWYELDDEVYVLTEDTEVDSEKEYYSNNRYYCYKELEYASVALVQNMLSNSSGFISTNGWIGQVYLSTITSDEVVQRTIHLDNSTYNTGFYDNRQLLSPKGFVNGEKYIVAVKGTGTLETPILKLVDKTDPNSESPILTFNQTTGFTTPDELDGYTVKMATCGSTISYSTIINNYGDIRFYLGYSGDLIDCKVFKYRTDSAGKMIVPDLEQLYYKVINLNGKNPKNEGWYELSSGDYILTNDTSIINGKNYYKKESPIIQTRYNFFLESSIPNNAIYTKQDLIITDSLLDTTTGYEPVMIDGCQKVTSITGSKSNRFNLIQSLCEAFECWAKFTIEHDENGKIIYKYIVLPESEYVKGGRYYQRISGSGESSNDSFFKIYKGTSFTSGLYKKVYSKYVTFKEYIGEDNPIGFRYGINLQSIQRNIISDQIASKVIVQANSNEFAPNGSCTIQQSVLNPTGENALYNFQYFINHGLLDATSLYDDLYGTNGGLGFYTKMKQYNDSIQPKIQELSEISKSLYTLNSRQTVYNALIEEATKLRDDASLELNTIGYNKERNYTAVSSPSGNPKKKGWYEKNNNKYVLTSDKTVQNGKTYYKAVSVGTTGSNNAPEYVDEIRERINSYINTIDYYETLSQRNKILLDAYTEKYNTISEDLTSIRALKDKLNQDFANKYYRFIQEGTWNSEDYWDPELYYQAANMVLYTSSFPQVSYSINVLEISEIEGFEAYKFKIADKTYIEDTEFFGYDSKGRPYKEEIVVSQVTRHLDDNSQNTITVQNYKTQFQDLFQRIAATSQSLQYHEGAYQRAASAINNDGTINSALLQNSLEANALVIQNANNQSVIWDETGITISNFINANEIVRLTSNGIVLSTDGGRSWTTGITGNGINADVITAGRIDTDRIRIFNAAMQQTFEWNSTGINAYMSDDNTVNYGKFVRFDQYGLYGYAGGNPAWDPRVEDSGSIGINKVIRDSIFSLTWNGLHIKTGAQGGFTQIADPSGNPKAQMWYESSSDQYILTNDTEVESGKIYYKSNDEVINVNDKFKVDGQGNVIATSGSFTGEIHATSGSFTGEIHATSGSFTGEVHATNAIFDTIDASKVTVNGQSITGNTNKIQSGYLNLYGIDVTKGSTSTFKVENDGTVTINGNITMGSGSTIQWGSVTTTGTSPYATTGALSSVSTTASNAASTANSAASTANSAASTASTASSNVSKLANGTYSGGTFISSTTIKSPKLQGGSVEILNSSSNRVGYLSMGTASSSSYALTLYSDYALRLAADNGSVYIKNSSGTDILIQNSNIALGGTVSIGGTVTVAGSLIPAAHNTYALGYSNQRWSTVYAYQVYNNDGVITSSDRNKKENINYDLSKYDGFIKELRPVSYKFKDGHRSHIGFISQDIEESLLNNDIDSEDFAGFIKEYDEYSNGYSYGLRYSEFIALQQWQIQKLEARIQTLENLISSQNSDIL